MVCEEIGSLIYAGGPVFTYRSCEDSGEGWDRKIDNYSDIELPRWKKDEQKTVFCIKTSLEKVRNNLVAAGWEPDNTEAKYHYDFIMHEVPKMDKIPEKVEDDDKNTDNWQRYPERDA